MTLTNYNDFSEKDRWFNRIQIDTIQDFDNFYRLSKSCNTLCFRTVEEAKFRNYTSIQRSWILQDEKLCFDIHKSVRQHIVDNILIPNNINVDSMYMPNDPTTLKIKQILKKALGF